MNNNITNKDLIAAFLRALIPVAQKFLDQEMTTQTPGTQMSLVKDEQPKDIKQLVFQKISRNTRLKTRDMIQMVDLKIKGKSQCEIAQVCNTSQSRVSQYLRAFKTQYAIEQKAA